MRRRFFLVDNTVAGYGRRTLVAQVVALLEGGGAEVRRCAAAGEQQVLELTARAARSGQFDAAIAAGGDGTIRLAAAAVADTSTPLGVIPLGTANVLALEIGLPWAAEPLAAMLRSGPAIQIQVPTANGTAFLLMAGAGFDGRVIEALSNDVKGRIGKLAYIGPLMAALAGPRDALEVTIDGQVREASWAVIANARHYGGAFVIADATRLQRPGLEAVLFKGADRAHLISSLLALARGRLASCRHVARIACTRAEIRSGVPIPVQIDGDVFGTTPLVVESRGPRLSLIVPAESN